MSELDRAKAWNDLVNKLRELRYDDNYKEELAGCIEHYLAALKADGFPMDQMIILGPGGKVYIVSITELPALVRKDLNILNYLRRMWGGVQV